MPITNSKITNPQRRYARGKLASEIRKKRSAAQKKNLSKKIKELMKIRARNLAKAFRNSQKKHGVKEAEARRIISTRVKKERKN